MQEWQEDTARRDERTAELKQAAGVLVRPTRDGLVIENRSSDPLDAPALLLVGTSENSDYTDLAWLRPPLIGPCTRYTVTRTALASVLPVQEATRDTAAARRSRPFESISGIHLAFRGVAEGWWIVSSNGAVSPGPRDSKDAHAAISIGLKEHLWADTFLEGPAERNMGETKVTFGSRDDPLTGFLAGDYAQLRSGIRSLPCT